jgi:hypothetical protein
LFRGRFSLPRLRLSGIAHAVLGVPLFAFGAFAFIFVQTSCALGTGCTPDFDRTPGLLEAGRFIALALVWLFVAYEFGFGRGKPLQVAYVLAMVWWVMAVINGFTRANDTLAAVGVPASSLIVGPSLLLTVRRYVWGGA